MDALTESDFTSPTWLRLKALFEARLAELRIKNDGRLSPEDTERLRGRVYEINLFLALPESKAPPPETNDA